MLCVFARSLYPLQQLRRLEADVEPVHSLAAEFDGFELSKSCGGLHFTINWARCWFPSEGQGHSKMSISPHLAP